MTPSPEKAAPIPADVLALAEVSLPSWYRAGYHVTDAAWVYCIASAILADREARPSLPDSREERIRNEAAEDERDRLYVLINLARIPAASAVLREQGALHPNDRARARQGGDNG